MGPAIYRLLRTLRWSNSRQANLERGAALALLLGVVLLAVYANRLPALVLVVSWAALLVCVAVFLRRGWVKLFGPVLFYDMIRAARRGRYFLLRFLYTALIFFVLLAVFSGGQGSAFQDARAAEAFFNAFLAVQLIAVSVLTPAYVAGAITEEKERKTLEFLLATDLRNREIVLSKLLSRLANLTLFLLSGLPILSMVQFLGGVDPTLLLLGFFITYLTMLGLGGLSILYSTLLRKSRDAIALTYLTTATYLALSTWSFTALQLSPPSWSSGPRLPFIPWTFDNLIAGGNAGNLGILYAELQRRIMQGVDPVEMWGLADGYLLFHALLFTVCVAWAVFRLRAVALKETQSRIKRRRYLGLFRRPRVGSLPMLWKEVHIDGRFRLSWLGWIVLLIVGAATLGPGLFFLYRVFNYLAVGAPLVPRGGGMWGGWGGDDWHQFQMQVNFWVRLAGTGVACVALLAVAIRAAGSVSGEREKQTLDGLLASPLESRDIYLGKWVGSLLCVRWLWLWLGIIWGLGVLLGGLSPFAVPLLAAAWLAYAAAFAHVGLFFSTASRSSMRATVWTLLVLTAVCFGHWLPWMCCAFNPMMYGGPGTDDLARFQVGLTPPVVLGIVAFTGWEFQYHDPAMLSVLFHCGLGTVLWGTAALILWASNQNYFRLKMNRDPGWLSTRHPGVPPPESESGLAETPMADEAAPPPVPRGAVLLDEHWEGKPPAGGSRVVLLDETWEDPRAPRPDDEPGKRP